MSFAVSSRAATQTTPTQLSRAVAYLAITVFAPPSCRYARIALKTCSCSARSDAQLEVYPSPSPVTESPARMMADWRLVLPNTYQLLL